MELDQDICLRAVAARDARFDGRIFVAVRTTGIYCRPICPARTPKRENVTFYPSAAAAQAAGYRPCLRCRPECSPEIGAWRGTSNSVSRALALINDGGLDDAAVDHLAERLGIGERQLRRLFQQHLGASPIAVAQTKRVLFAKQLIAETTMPLAQVALAAGFGSVRRFNAIFQALFDRPPRDLRRPRSEKPTYGEAGITLRLSYQAPYDWAAISRFLAARAIPGVELVNDRGHYRRSIAIAHHHGAICVAPDPHGNRLAVNIRIADIATLAIIVGRVRHLFDLGADPALIGAHLSQDAILRPLVAARPGLRVPGAWDGFELAVRGMLGQQITVGAATKLAGKLVAAHGTPLQGNDDTGLTHVFPSAAIVAAADLRALGMPGARARAISAIAAAAAADPRLFAMGQENDAAMTRLRALPGVGDWTAQYIAMRALREPDAFLPTDIGLLRAMKGSDGIRPAPAEILARAEAWRPWRAYAALHLWTNDANPTRITQEHIDAFAA